MKYLVRYEIPTAEGHWRIAQINCIDYNEVKKVKKRIKELGYHLVNVIRI